MELRSGTGSHVSRGKNYQVVNLYFFILHMMEIDLLRGNRPNSKRKEKKRVRWIRIVTRLTHQRSNNARNAIHGARKDAGGAQARDGASDDEGGAVGRERRR